MSYKIYAAIAAFAAALSMVTPSQAQVYGARYDTVFCDSGSKVGFVTGLTLVQGEWITRTIKSGNTIVTDTLSIEKRLDIHVGDRVNIAAADSQLVALFQMMTDERTPLRGKGGRVYTGAGATLNYYASQVWRGSREDPFLGYSRREQNQKPAEVSFTVSRPDQFGSEFSAMFRVEMNKDRLAIVVMDPGRDGVTDQDTKSLVGAVMTLILGDAGNTTNETRFNTLANGYLPPLSTK